MKNTELVTFEKSTDGQGFTSNLWSSFGDESSDETVNYSNGQPTKRNGQEWNKTQDNVGCVNGHIFMIHLIEGFHHVVEHHGNSI